MANTYTQLLYHFVFSTKHRDPLITPELREELHKYIGGIIRAERSTALIVNGIADHVHILARMPTDITIADMLRLIKANSSKWINESGRCPESFAWQIGYSAFTVSASMLSTVEAYIRHQETHHKKMTFQEESLTLLERHGVEFDPKYLWD